MKLDHIEWFMYAFMLIGYVAYLVERNRFKYFITCPSFSIKAQNKKDLEMQINLVHGLKEQFEPEEYASSYQGREYDRWLYNEIMSLAARTAKFRDMIEESGLRGRIVDQPFADDIRKLMGEIKEMEDATLSDVETVLRPYHRS